MKSSELAHSVGDFRDFEIREAAKTSGVKIMKYINWMKGILSNFRFI